MQAFGFNLEDNLFELHRQLEQKTYRPDAYEFFYVRDPKLRPIHKATVKDRVVFQAVFRILYDIFDKQFIYDSYACRISKGTHAGASRLELFLRKCSHNYSHQIFALKCDIKQFFYSIDHCVLLGLLQREINDPDLLDLISRIVESFHTQPGVGLPLGNVTSQLFANIYLNELDQYVKHVLKEKWYVRYCDDFVIVSNNQVRLANLIPLLKNFLQYRLLLSLHPRKVEIRKQSQGIDFLGYVLLPHYRVLRTRTKRRMFKNLTKENLQSYLGMLKHCSGYTTEQQLKRRPSRTSL